MKRNLLIVGLLLAFSASIPISQAEMAGDKAEATFTVHCYDVGASALEGLPGIISVEKGWRNFREVNRVIYDPGKISVQQMEKQLKNSGTYTGTVKERVPKKN